APRSMSPDTSLFVRRARESSCLSQGGIRLGCLVVRRRPGIALPLFAMVAAGLAPSRAAAAPVQPALPAYAVLGVSDVMLRPRVRVQTGSVGSTGGELRLASHVTASGRGVADVVRIGNGTTVDPIFCRLVTGGAFGRGVVGGPSVQGAVLPPCQPMVEPVVDPALLAPVAVTPGTAEVRIPPGTGTSPYPPGSYAAITVGSGPLP